MMKNILEVAALAAFGAACLGLLLMRGQQAQAGEPTTAVTDGLASTQTCTGVGISTSVPTNVLTSTQSAANQLFRWVGVQNWNASKYVSCSENPSVSTATAYDAAGNPPIYGGTIVPPGSPVGALVKWALVPGMSWYCLSQAASTTTWVNVCRGR